MSIIHPPFTYEDNTYKCELVRTVDGDTVEAWVSWIDSNKKKSKTLEMIRFFGINAPETKGDTREAGLQTKNFVYMKLIDVPFFWIELKEPIEDNFGRLLAVVYLPSGLNLCQELLDLGLAVPYVK